MNRWYWCLTHERAEPEGQACRNLERLGPYPTPADAEHWKERVDERNEAWDEQDEAWEEGTHEGED